MSPKALQGVPPAAAPMKGLSRSGLAALIVLGKAGPVPRPGALLTTDARETVRRLILEAGALCRNLGCERDLS